MTREFTFGIHDVGIKTTHAPEKVKKKPNMSNIKRPRTAKVSIDDAEAEKVINSLDEMFGIDEEDEEKETVKASKEKHKKKSKKKKAVKKEAKKPNPEKERIKREKAELKKKQHYKDCEIRMIQLNTRKDMLLRKLNELDRGKERDSRIIASINIELINIRDELDRLSEETGIEQNNVNTGTKFGRFISGVKTKAKSIFKKVKRACKRNKELIVGVASMVVPVIISFGVKLIFKI